MLMVLKRNLTDAQRVMLKDYLLERLANDELPRGTLQAAAVEFSVTRQTCSRLWKAWGVARATALNGKWDVKSGPKGSGCGHKYNRDDVAQAVRDLPLRQRTTVRLLEGALAISKSTVNQAPPSRTSLFRKLRITNFYMIYELYMYILYIDIYWRHIFLGLSNLLSRSTNCTRCHTYSGTPENGFVTLILGQRE